MCSLEIRPLHMLGFFQFIKFANINVLISAIKYIYDICVFTHSIHVTIHIDPAENSLGLKQEQQCNTKLPKI